MQMPPQVVLRGVESTPFIEGLLNRGIAKLEQVCDYIVSMRIAVEQVQKRHRTGNSYRMRVDIRIPDHEIKVERSSVPPGKVIEGSASPLVLAPEEESEPEPKVARAPAVGRLRDEALAVLIRRTFESARRELEKAVDKQRGEVKAHAQPEAVVEKIFRDKDYGFLRTLEGQQVYFHRNSVLHGHWENLTAGAGVRFTAELGEKGLQASTVEMVDKPGAAEMHDELHELPAVATRRARKKS